MLQTFRFRLASPMLRFAATLACGLVVVGCAALQNINWNATLQPKPPRLAVAGVDLVQAPTNRALAGHFCSRYAPAVVCGAAFGPVLAVNQMRFVFDVRLNATNDNKFPVPVVEVLTAFRAFPETASAQNLGAVCMTMCEQGGACAQGPGACRSETGRDVRTVQDFAGAAAGFLFATAQGTAGFDQLRIRTIPAGGTAEVKLQLELGAATVLALLEQVAKGAVQQASKGQEPQFAIPYNVEGTAWVRVEKFGRIGAGFGPFAGNWALR